MELINATPFKVLVVPHFDKDGNEVATIIVKGTFALGARMKVEPLPLDQQVDVTMADEHWGEPGRSPVKQESDLAIFKPATDIMMTGYARHPRKSRIKRVEVSLKVGTCSKALTVESPDPSERIPLHYTELLAGTRQWLFARKKRDGFGFVPRHERPRATFAGTYDEAWKNSRAPFLPADFDYRFFQAAYPGLISQSYLRGDEPVQLANASPDGPITSRLPGVTVDVEVRLDKAPERTRAALDTVILEPEERRLILIWRKMAPIYGPMSMLKAVGVTSSALHQ